MAAQSDPDLNPNFRRRWSAPPLRRERPRIVGAIQGAQNSRSGSSDENSTEATQCIQWACTLDGVADAELQHGHHLRAEHFARRAAEIREGAR